MTRLWCTHHVVEDMAVGRTRHARVAHLDTSRRDIAVYIPEMDEYAFAVESAAAEVARRRRRDGSANKWTRFDKIRSRQKYRFGECSSERRRQTDPRPVLLIYKLRCELPHSQKSEAMPSNLKKWHNEYSLDTSEGRIDDTAEWRLHTTATAIAVWGDDTSWCPSYNARSRTGQPPRTAGCLRCS